MQPEIETKRSFSTFQIRRKLEGVRKNRFSLALYIYLDMTWKINAKLFEACIFSNHKP